MPAPLFSGGYGPIATIVNYFSSGGVSTNGAVASIAAGVNNGCKETLSGALTANTLATVHNITGRGRLNLLTCYSKDATARTIRCQVIIDGVTVFDATSSSVGSSNLGMVPIGTVDGNGAAQQYGLIQFYQSCVVKIASSLTETDKIATGILYETWV